MDKQILAQLILTLETIQCSLRNAHEMAGHNVVDARYSERVDTAIAKLKWLAQKD
jgi:hypothetical protein